MPSLHLWLQLEDFYAKGFSSLLDLDSSTTTCNTHIDRAFSNIFTFRKISILVYQDLTKKNCFFS